jgi:hypothetical protein
MLDESAIKALSNTVLLRGIGGLELEPNALRAKIFSDFFGNVFLGIVTMKSLDMFSSLIEDVHIILSHSVNDLLRFFIR